LSETRRAERFQPSPRKSVADETDRRLFLVEHDLRGLAQWQLAAVQRALGEAVRRENRRGGQIRYVQCIYAPDEQRCLCLFEAAGPDLVRSVNDVAQFPLARIIAVLSSVPDARGRRDASTA
jgi:Nickel responsive protein SCO4226-like